MLIRIGTRKSPLALAQAEEVQARLQAAHPGLAVELVPMTTSGDRFTDRPLADIGGKGLFTKEIEDALLSSEVDLAVHSAKDMLTILPDGLTIGAVLPREDARDVLISRSGAVSIATLPPNATLGSASLRRSTQALHIRPDLSIVPLRGNVATRLRKIEEGEADATLLALAGLKRLKLSPIPGAILSMEEILPAAAQGAIAIESRAGDAKIQALLHPIDHVPTHTAIRAERALLKKLDGSCRTPIAAYAECVGKKLSLRAMLLSDDGKERAVATRDGLAKDAVQIGTDVGAELRAALPYC